MIKRKEIRIKIDPRLALIGLRTTGPWMVKDNGEESFFLKKKKHAILRPDPGSGGEGGGLFLKAQVTFRARREILI